MIFTSWQFVVFFAVVAAAYFCLPGRLRWMWLLAASLFFFAYAGPIYLVQIAIVILVVYYVGLQIERADEKSRKHLVLWTGVGLVILNLAVYKYASFFNESFRSVFGTFGLPYPIPAFALLIPIGISFRAFTLIGYLVDIYRGEKAEKNLGQFALFVTFFPKLIAGPIERARNLLPQFKVEHSFDYARIVAGLQLMAWGAFKKLVVADRLAPIVASVYDNPHAFDGASHTFATVLYAFQIYCDFSGYTDIALGTALVLGFKLTQNFNRPYFATSIQDFWKRWHISLTSWLTDYVFNPLIKSKLFKIKFYNLMLISMFATFVVSGLWHGANWTFVLWGAMHGGYIVIALLLQKPFNAWVMKIGLNKRPQLYRGLKIAFTFALVCLAYIPFRASSLSDVFYIYGHLFTGWGNAVDSFKAVVGLLREEFMLGVLGVVVVMTADAWRGNKVDIGAAFAARPAWVRWSVYYAGAASIVLLGAFYNANHEFIYFRF